MKCEEFRELELDLAMGRLDEDTAAAAKAHMESCPECRDEYMDCCSIAEVMSQLREEKAPEDMADNIMRRVRSDRMSRRVRVLRIGTAVAAAALLVAGIVTAVPRMGSKKDEYISDDQIYRNTASETETAGDDELGNDHATFTYSDKAESDVADEETAPTENSETYFDTGASAGEADAPAIASTEGKSAPRKTAMVDSVASSESSEEFNSTSGNADNAVQSEGADKNGDTRNEDSGAALSGSASGVDIYSAGDSVTSKSRSGYSNDRTTGVTEDSSDEKTENQSSDENTGAKVYTVRDDAVGFNHIGSKGSGGGTSPPISDEEDESADTSTATDKAGREEAAVGDEPCFIHIIAEFYISGENAGAAAEVSPEGKSIDQLRDELDALGVSYGIYLTNEDLTSEYKSATPQRRAEIEALCAGESCVIVFAKED